MNLKHLSYFIEIVQQESFTKAANELFVCQSALSKAVKSLERELDVSLVDRKSKSFKLTDEGHILYDYGKDMLRVVEEQQERLIEKLKSKGGKLRVGIPPVISTAYFSYLIYGFREAYPDIELEVIEAGANTIKALVDELKVDIGVVILPFPYDEDYDITPAMSSEIILLVNQEHHLAHRREVRFRELKDEKFLILNDSYMLHDKIINNCHQAGFTPNIISESSQWDFLAEMVKLNQGISILPKPIMERFYSKEIRMVRLKEPDFPWNIAMIVKKEKFMSEQMDKFIAYVIKNKDYVSGYLT